MFSGTFSLSTAEVFYPLLILPHICFPPVFVSNSVTQKWQASWTSYHCSRQSSFSASTQESLGHPVKGWKEMNCMKLFELLDKKCELLMESFIKIHSKVKEIESGEISLALHLNQFFNVKLITWENPSMHSSAST